MQERNSLTDIEKSVFNNGEVRREGKIKGMGSWTAIYKINKQQG